EKQMARELKAIAGLAPTPSAPDARTIAELTNDVGTDLPKALDSQAAREREGDGDGVEALLALTETSSPVHAVPAHEPVSPVPVPVPVPIPIVPAALPVLAPPEQDS